MRTILFIMLIIFLSIFFLGIVISSCKQNKHSVAKEFASAKKKAEKNRNLTLAPDFSLKDINGNNFKLSNFKGKVIILDFWATWCPPCRAEIPSFNELYSKYKKDGLEIIGISLDDGENVVKKFAEEQNIKYILAMGDENIVGIYGGIVGIPTTFVIDRGGNIVDKHVGFAEKSIFEDQIKKLL